MVSVGFGGFVRLDGGCFRLLGRGALRRALRGGSLGERREGRGAGLLAFAQDGAQAGDLSPGDLERHGILQLAGAALELQVEHLAVGLVDRLGEFGVGERARFVGKWVGHG